MKQHTDRLYQTLWYHPRRQTLTVQTTHPARRPDRKLTGCSHYQPAHKARTQPLQPTLIMVLPCLAAALMSVVFPYANSYCHLFTIVVAKGHIHTRVRVKQRNFCFSTFCFDFKRRIADTPQRHTFGQVLQDVFFTFRHIISSVVERIAVSSCRWIILISVSLSNDRAIAAIWEPLSPAISKSEILCMINKL